MLYMEFKHLELFAQRNKKLLYNSYWLDKTPMICYMFEETVRKRMTILWLRDWMGTQEMWVQFWPQEQSPFLEH